MGPKLVEDIKKLRFPGKIISKYGFFKNKEDFHQWIAFLFGISYLEIFDFLSNHYLPYNYFENKFLVKISKNLYSFS